MHHISPKPIALKTFYSIVTTNKKVGLSDESRALIQKARTYLDDKMRTHDAPIYGINTGFGSLCDVRISADQIEQLQTNLVMSHACGIGDEVPAEVVGLMLLLKVQSLAYGYSGVQVATCERLLYFYNNNILPVVYQQGSLGASGDLAPLAHLCLPLLGLGEVYYKGKRMTGAAALAKAGLEPIRLQSKEGLALLNGTQFSLSYSLWCMMQTTRLSRIADICAALSADAWHCRTTPFDERLHSIRKQTGQIETAKTIRKLLENSEIAALEKPQVQDPYSFRCVPQVHGASKDAFAYAEAVFTKEANAVTDNPNVFVADDDILSGGNFHAQPLALALDFLAIALAELGSISERRTYLLISGQRGLPTYLAKAAGLHSGLMIPQYTAASIASQNKQLCTPASVDSIVSSNGQEDHVSMAANAATKCFRVVQNVERILAIEWLNATQALEFRRPMQTSPILESYVKKYRETVAFADIDRIFSDDMHKTVAFIKKEL
jgi:histidine ammonia-lyase